MSQPIPVVTNNKREWWVATDDGWDTVMGPFPYQIDASFVSGWIKRGLRKAEKWANGGWMEEAQ